jgi:hypothetical protein
VIGAGFRQVRSVPDQGSGNLPLPSSNHRECRPTTLAGRQETLAEMIGTTRSRVSFFMNKFRKLGFLSYNGKIEVHSSLLNAVLYDKPELKSDE